jgi:hypothetical protein
MKDRYMLFNLCAEKQYDSEKFEGRAQVCVLTIRPFYRLHQHYSHFDAQALMS